MTNIRLPLVVPPKIFLKNSLPRQNISWLSNQGPFCSILSSSFNGNSLIGLAILRNEDFKQRQITSFLYCWPQTCDAWEEKLHKKTNVFKKNLPLWKKKNQLQLIFAIIILKWRCQTDYLNNASIKRKLQHPHPPAKPVGNLTDKAFHEVVNLNSVSVSGFEWLFFSGAEVANSSKMTRVWTIRKIQKEKKITII